VSSGSSWDQDSSYSGDDDDEEGGMMGELSRIIGQ
jgi:hypothetical protein